MPRIFISYRRADSAHATDSIFLQMAQHFGSDNVFLDVGSIPFGVDFRAYLREQIAAYDVVLVVIGPDWGRILHERREQENDFVRLEVESALQQGKLVIPVLVMDAKLPDFRDLPESVQELQWRNSATVRRLPDLISDCERLAQGIRAAFAARPSAAPSAPEPSAVHRVEDLLPPPFAWCDVPAGTVTVGVATFVPAFAIAKYLITNAQYRVFVEAGGYGQARWWTKQGWQTRVEKDWQQPRFWRMVSDAESSHPVVGVSWYEAIAFCRWLQTVWDEGQSPSNRERISLPTEQQWQRAAQGGDGRAYPWGDVFGRSRCNSHESGIGTTTSVQQYEGKGSSPFGVVDLSGNVLEWCATDFETGLIDLEGPSVRRVLRGGAWNLDKDYANVTVRSDDHPIRHGNNSGFRIVRVPTP